MFFYQNAITETKQVKPLTLMVFTKSAHLLPDNSLEAFNGFCCTWKPVKFRWKHFKLDFSVYARPHPDYGDIICHEHHPEFTRDMTKRLERIQYSAALALNGAWRGTKIDRLYEELGWKSLCHRRWYRRLCYFSSSP